jgi:hypothetical protein
MKVQNKRHLSTAAVLAASLAVSASAFAAGDPGVDAITALSSTAQTYITAAFGVAVLVAGGFWGIRMMKKAFSKAG